MTQRAIFAYGIPIWGYPGRVCSAYVTAVWVGHLIHIHTLEVTHRDLKTGAWILSLIAIASLFVIVLAENAPRSAGLLSVLQPAAASSPWA